MKFLRFKTKETILSLAGKERFYLAGEANKPGQRICTMHSPKAKGIRRGTEGSERSTNTVPNPVPGTSRLKHDDETQIYETVEEATQDLSRRGFPLEIIKLPESLIEQLHQLTWERSNQRAGRRTFFCSVFNCCLLSVSSYREGKAFQVYDLGNGAKSLKCKVDL